MIGRWVPQPLLSLALLITWLLLVNSASLGQIVLGGVFALLLPVFTARFWPRGAALRRPQLLILFVGRLLVDIVTANISVARLILGPQAALQPRFIHYPLALQDELAITILAGTISLTPGTVSSDLSPDRRSLLIHCLHVVDEAALIEQLKRRYETLLQEMFAPC